MPIGSRYSALQPLTMQSVQWLSVQPELRDQCATMIARHLQMLQNLPECVVQYLLQHGKLCDQGSLQLWFRHNAKKVSLPLVCKPTPRPNESHPHFEGFTPPL
ncbi:hypothetical protein D3C76_1637440 [compost metagenome]